MNGDTKNAPGTPSGTLGGRLAARVSLVLLLVGILLFGPAGTLSWWQAWIWLGVWILPATTVVIRLWLNDPDLLERRMRLKEREAGQRRIITIAWLLFVVAFAIPGFDHRYGWSEVPVALVAAGDGIIFAAYLLFFRVLLVNRWASRTVEIEPGQAVVTTGPYAVVRHPMYVAALVIYCFSPLALGSYVGMLASLLLIVPIVARIRNEEALLQAQLPGYREYMMKTRYRLIPRIW